MTSFGRYLAQERELRALSREEVARLTRLSLTAIAALEEDRFAELPPEVFTLGYIRSYAGCIGLDADEAVLRYRETRPIAAPTEAPMPVRAGGRRVWLAALILGGLALLAAAALRAWGH